MCATYQNNSSENETNWGSTLTNINIWRLEDCQIEQSSFLAVTSHVRTARRRPLIEVVFTANYWQIFRDCDTRLWQLVTYNVNPTLDWPLGAFHLNEPSSPPFHCFNVALLWSQLFLQILQNGSFWNGIHRSYENLQLKNRNKSNCINPCTGLAQSVKRLTEERELACSIPGTEPTLRVLK